MENKNRKRIKNPWISIIAAMVTLALNSLFLWGKLIDFPIGEPEGGRFAAIGVFVIIVSVVAITYLVVRLTGKKIEH